MRSSGRGGCECLPFYFYFAAMSVWYRTELTRKDRYHCLFCDGYEDRGAASAGVLVGGEVSNAGAALHMARMAKRLSEKVKIYTNGDEELGRDLMVPAGKEDVEIERRKVVGLEKNDGVGSGVTVHLEDGAQMTDRFLVSTHLPRCLMTVELQENGQSNHLSTQVNKPRGKVNGPFVSQLGLELTEMGVIKVTPPFHETSVKGVFAVGDCASPIPAVVNALAMGALAAGGLVAQLQSES
jgi:gliotoxin/aspirochlorine biosynthesis thioredoxin reductase